MVDVRQNRNRLPRSAGRDVEAFYAGALQKLYVAEITRARG
jgi:hypothetical protein